MPLLKMQFDRSYLKSVIQQIVSKATDHSHSMAGIANERLLSHRTQGGDLLGPRRPVVKP